MVITMYFRLLATNAITTLNSNCYKLLHGEQLIKAWFDLNNLLRELTDAVVLIT